MKPRSRSSRIAVEAIERLLAAQITLRNSRRLAKALRSNRLPAIKTLADFDFSFQPSIKRDQIDSLHELGVCGSPKSVHFSMAIDTAQARPQRTPRS